MDKDEGVFDFPWLKEGVIFEVENDCLQLEDVFASFEVSPSISSFEFPSVQLVNSPNDDEKIDLPSLRVDDLEGADWICGSAIDDPLLPPNKVVWVPGSFEIAAVAERFGKYSKYQAFLCIGAVIRGDTTHYDAVGNSAAFAVFSAGLNSGRDGISF